ncbi:MAG: ribonuclease III [Puniceicoccales bacterium]|jgi:ribonuclease-3|nr:ribonuclease III [Puniceicoccales bacterium]
MVEDLEERLGYRFRNRKLLALATTHPSYWKGQTKARPHFHYQRLEFLGDAVLGCILSHHLFRTYPKQNEGFLSKAHSLLCRREFLIQRARIWNLQDHIKAGTSELKDMPDSILEDVFEALVGAVFLDTDFSEASDLVLKWLGDIQNQLKHHLEQDNPKGRLQELIGSKAKELNYRSRETTFSGPHPFHSEVYLGEERCGEGFGRTKKQAENKAAEAALKTIKKKLL